MHPLLQQTPPHGTSGPCLERACHSEAVLVPPNGTALGAGSPKARRTPKTEPIPDTLSCLGAASMNHWVPVCNSWLESRFYKHNPTVSVLYPISCTIAAQSRSDKGLSNSSVHICKTTDSSSEDDGEKNPPLIKWCFLLPVTNSGYNWPPAVIITGFDSGWLSHTVTKLTSSCLMYHITSALPKTTPRSLKNAQLWAQTLEKTYSYSLCWRKAEGDTGLLTFLDRVRAWVQNKGGKGLAGTKATSLKEKNGKKTVYTNSDYRETERVKMKELKKEKMDTRLLPN